MRLTCFISDMKRAGSQRVLATLASGWADAGHTVSLVSLSRTEADAISVRGVERIGLDLLRPSHGVLQAFRSNLERIAELRWTIKKLSPDAVVSFGHEANVITLIACLGTSRPVVISERVHPGHEAKARSWQYLRQLTYRRAAALVVPTQYTAKWASLAVTSGRVRVIPNPLDPRFQTPAANPGHRGRRLIVAMGRLVPQKGFDVLLDAFASVQARHPGWRLAILGEGPEQGSLTMLAEELNVAGSVSFEGEVRDPGMWLRRADIFVLASRYEGFPNAVLEAMACGCAVVATDCPAGPAEIIDDGVNGLLTPVGRSEPLAGGIEALISDPELRADLARAGAIRATDFRAKEVQEDWLALFKDLTMRSQHLSHAREGCRDGPR